METKTAVTALAALAQETRLAAYRLLVQAGEAGLVASHSAGRFVIYRADFAAMHGLIGYLSENCCGSSAAACAPVSLQPCKECA